MVSLLLDEEALALLIDIASDSCSESRDLERFFFFLRAGARLSLSDSLSSSVSVSISESLMVELDWIWKAARSGGSKSFGISKRLYL